MLLFVHLQTSKQANKQTDIQTRWSQHFSYYNLARLLLDSNKKLVTYRLLQVHHCLRVNFLTSSPRQVHIKNPQHISGMTHQRSYCTSNLNTIGIADRWRLYRIGMSLGTEANSAFTFSKKRKWVPGNMRWRCGRELKTSQVWLSTLVDLTYRWQVKCCVLSR